MHEREIIREKFKELSTGWLSQADWKKALKTYSDWLRQNKKPKEANINSSTMV